MGWKEAWKSGCGFTLLELLSVLACVSVLMALLVPAVASLADARKNGSTLVRLYDAVESARGHAMADATYVWMGFAEEGAASRSLVVSIIGSRDGTQIFNPNSGASATNRLDPARVLQLGPLLRLQQLRLADVANPTGRGTAWECRPSVKRGSVLYRIGASTPDETRFPFQYPIGNTVLPPEHLFQKTLQFNPRGEAVINGSYSYVPWMEIALEPAQGGARALQRQAVLQISGLSGNIRLYRK